MNIHNWPWRPNPDFTRTLKALSKKGDPGFVPFVELYADPEFIAAVLGENVVLSKDQEGDREALKALLDQKMRFCHNLGYDIVWQRPPFDIPGLLNLEAEDTASFNRSKRKWVDQDTNAISCWEDFESYPWPKPKEADYYSLEYLIKHLPEGMAIIVEIYAIHETLMNIMGCATMAYAIYDQPDLIQAIIDKLMEIQLPVLQTILQMERIIAVFMGDDMGYKTGTILAPKHLRKYIFPSQKKIVDLVHEQGIPFILHSCGKLEAIMDQLIDEVHIDAKHSFEDVIIPVESFASTYDRQIAIIGGLDIDLLARGVEEQVRVRTRQILRSCAPSRGYMLGSGNSLTNYLSIQNYLAMLDEGWCFNSS